VTFPDAGAHGHARPSITLSSPSTLLPRGDAAGRVRSGSAAPLMARPPAQSTMAWERDRRGESIDASTLCVVRGIAVRGSLGDVRRRVRGEELPRSCGRGHYTAPLTAGHRRLRAQRRDVDTDASSCWWLTRSGGALAKRTPNVIFELRPRHPRPLEDRADGAARTR
jgi:hypothetical protein